MHSLDNSSPALHTIHTTLHRIAVKIHFSIKSSTVKAGSLTISTIAGSSCIISHLCASSQWLHMRGLCSRGSAKEEESGGGPPGISAKRVSQPRLPHCFEPDFNCGDHKQRFRFFSFYTPFNLNTVALVKTTQTQPNRIDTRPLLKFSSAHSTTTPWINRKRYTPSFPVARLDARQPQKPLEKRFLSLIPHPTPLLTLT